MKKLIFGLIFFSQFHIAEAAKDQFVGICVRAHLVVPGKTWSELSTLIWTDIIELYAKDLVWDIGVLNTMNPTGSDMGSIIRYRHIHQEFDKTLKVKNQTLQDYLISKNSDFYNSQKGDNVGFNIARLHLDLHGFKTRFYAGRLLFFDVSDPGYVDRLKFMANIYPTIVKSFDVVCFNSVEAYNTFKYIPTKENLTLRKFKEIDYSRNSSFEETNSIKKQNKPRQKQPVNDEIDLNDTQQSYPKSKPKVKKSKKINDNPIEDFIGELF